ncbi:lysosomal alpha-mannosidase-like isoform X1 [Zophobas morio]|uniref:lysosomal alpha-mannosidase-like isoform X1 n=1 Tax=Zophobas morio TaxID=2755281 RepID=UPI003083AF42
MRNYIVPTVLILVLNSFSVKSSPVKPKNLETCQSCHPLVDGKINVHLVPHSHDDVGWLKTFSQYYYGTGDFTTYENAGVQYILNSTIKALKAKPDRRFIQVETAFFWKWWLHQDEATKQDTIDLVNNGQLEMINGAWSMNDEAAAHYQSIIDQFTWGFRILAKTVGECARPKIGWQIDPFGHSREHGSICKQFGFEGLVVGRIDYRDKARRKSNQSLDFIWKTSNNLNNSELFTTMFPDFYVDEPGYRFDVLHGNTIEDSNLNDKVNGFAKILDTYRKYYQTSNIMMPMGNDFTYQVAERNFKNMDKLIKGFQNHQTYNVFYSTPSCYIKAVQDEVRQKSIVLEEKTDDFFPYASNSNSYWTGYFTSRPTLKRFERIGNKVLQSVKQLATFSRIKDQDHDIYTLDLRQAMGVLQHHDAITGTEKQFVANDYAKLLDSAIKKAEEPLSEIITTLLGKNGSPNLNLNFSSCLLTNITVCDNSQKERFVVVVQNPLSRSVTHYVRLPVNSDGFKITGPDGEESFDVFESIHKFDYVRAKIASKELVFAARNLPPLGVKLYYVEKTSLSKRFKPFKKLTEDLYFGTKSNGFIVDYASGKVKSVTIKGITRQVNQEFLTYRTTSSGAYLFRPYDKAAAPIASKVGTYALGSFVDEYHQVINTEVTQITRVYKGENDAYIEFDWLVGNLQYIDSYGKELVTRYTIQDFNNNETFYTDSNGREMIKRQLNHRNDYSYDPSSSPVTGNYYPVTSKIGIKDETNKFQMAVLNDRAQGGTSLTEGSIELMLHRRLTQDDGLGVGETLNEKQYGQGLYARGRHFLTFGSTEANGTAAFERNLAEEVLLSPLVLLADVSTEGLTLEKIQGLLEFKFEGLTASLPQNVHILTLEPWIDSYLLRLEHILERGEDEELSKPVTVDLNKLFTLFSITKIRETSLGANEFLEDSEVGVTKTVTLEPMQIRTFIFETDGNNSGGNDDSDGDDDDDYSKGGDSTTRTTSSLFILLIVLNYLFM